MKQSFNRLKSTVYLKLKSRTHANGFVLTQQTKQTSVLARTCVYLFVSLSQNEHDGLQSQKSKGTFSLYHLIALNSHQLIKRKNSSQVFAFQGVNTTMNSLSRKCRSSLTIATKTFLISCHSLWRPESFERVFKTSIQQYLL